MNISGALAEVAALLAECGVLENRREASLLVMLAIGRDKAFVIAHPEYELTAIERECLNEFARRRGKREPFQYISGRQEFYGLEFEVSPQVLIPRPETEILVEKAIEIVRVKKMQLFCEIGIGSGCIAISILVNADLTRAIGSDNSREAIAVASSNARKHSVANRLKLIESDVFSGIRDERFDMIVSNPPYVPLSDIGGLQPEVREHEPVTALTDGGNGLSVIERLVNATPRHLRSGGNLLIEIGFDQSEKVAPMFDPKIWHHPEFLPDLQGIPRIVCAQLR